MRVSAPMSTALFSAAIFPAAVLTLSVAFVGCVGPSGQEGDPDNPTNPTDPTNPINPVTTRPVCPVDPDCSIGGDCGLYNCPEYWVCENIPGERKRCTNPGPGYPDDGEWECEDTANTTVCTRSGGEFPDGGGGGEWNCERSGEFVVCTDTTPTYPDGGAGGPYNCWFENDLRICESTSPDGGGGGFVCYDNADGVRECRDDSPDYPDDRRWTCYDFEGDTVCRSPGGDLPDGGGGGDWDCARQGEFVVCTDDTPDYPSDGGGGGTWDCRFGDEFRICTPPDYPSTGDDDCAAGAQRWCDDDVYCSWGKQTCLPDGSWGRCVEPTVTETGLTDRPATECGCRFFYFNDECCEDQEDRDGDGNADCLIPTEHAPPACSSDGGLCSFCDSHTDCGGEDDMCVFRRDGYAMCASSCEGGAGCPAGYECSALATREGTSYQCVSQVGSCE